MKKLSTLLILAIFSSFSYSFAQVGSKIDLENITLQDLEGALINFSLSQYQDKACIVLIFTSTDCAYDQAYQFGIEDALSQFEGQSVAFIFVNPKEEDILMQKKQAEIFGQVYLSDKDKILVTKLSITKTPEVRILQNNGGNFILKYQGLIDDSANGGTDNFLILAIEATLQKQPVKTPSLEPVGCSF